LRGGGAGGGGGGGAATGLAGLTAAFGAGALFRDGLAARAGRRDAEVRFFAERAGRAARAGLRLEDRDFTARCNFAMPGG
jgi:hypothetical protein